MSSNDNKKTDTLSKFICTVYKPIYAVALLLVIITSVVIFNVSKRFSSFTYMAILISLVIMMCACYFISKDIKKKKNKLEIHTVSFVKKFAFVSVSVLASAIMFVLITVILSGILTKLIINQM